MDKRNFKLLFLLGLIGFEASTEIFVRIPQAVIYGSTPSPLKDISSKNLVVIFPGAGGPDIYTDNLRNKIMENDKRKLIKRSVYVYDWSKWRGNFLRASFDGQEVGRTVCSAFADKMDLESLHVIGVSVGAFAADSCVKTYKNDATNPAPVRETFLDPFTSKGVFGYAWGQKNFGKAADVVEDYFNGDDPVPTTNGPLPLTYAVDVTDSKRRASFIPKDGDSMHSWPVVYLAQQWKSESDSKGHVKFPSRDEEPSGVVVKAD